MTAPERGTNAGCAVRLVGLGWLALLVFAPACAPDAGQIDLQIEWQDRPPPELIARRNLQVHVTIESRTDPDSRGTVIASQVAPLNSDASADLTLDAVPNG